MNKRFLMAGIAALLILTAILGDTVPAYAVSGKFGGGNGTKEEPYLISEYRHLLNICYDKDAFFSLVNDITIPDEAYDGGGLLSQGWQAIDFAGELYGNGYRIENLIISGRNSYAGLFSVNGGVIRDLTVASSKISVGGDFSYGGFLVAVNEGSVINCMTEANEYCLCGEGEYTLGGVVGENLGILEKSTNCSELDCNDSSGKLVIMGGLAGVNIGRIVDSRNLSQVSVASDENTQELYLGGIAGADFGGEIISSYNKGKISVEYSTGDAYAYIGGVAGASRNCAITDCYNSGKIHVESRGAVDTASFGGVMGICEGAKVSNVYTVGAVSVAENPGEAFCGAGLDHEESKFKNCYYLYDGQVTGQGAYMGLIAKTAEALTQLSTYSGFDFSDTWTFDGNPLYPYPELQSVEMVYMPEDICQTWDHAFGDFVENNDATEEKCATMTAVCQRCAAKVTVDIPGSMLKKQGWRMECWNWRYYIDGVPAKNCWIRDSVGWVYLGSDGFMLRDAWCRDSYGWCYVGWDGYMLTDCWRRDSYDWCYIGADGYMVTDSWLQVYGCWKYMDHNGYAARNRWVISGGKWYYLDEEGYMVTLDWRRDSVGWVFLGADGAMKTNAWCIDSKGWCYVGADGYAVTNCWKQDSFGWIRFDGEGSMLKDCWLSENGCWYYLGLDGYMLSDASCRIDGRSYRFAANGVCINP